MRTSVHVQHLPGHLTSLRQDPLMRVVMKRNPGPSTYRIPRGGYTNVELNSAMETIHSHPPKLPEECIKGTVELRSQNDTPSGKVLYRKFVNFYPQEQTRVVTTQFMLDPTTVRLLRPDAILLRRKRQPVNGEARAS